MQRFDQSPTDPDFIQNPYPFYESVRAAGPLAWWDAYDLPVAAGYDAVNAFFRDRRFGRENPAPPPRPPHQAAFWAVEDHSMLEADPPRHTRLRAQVARAFTSRQIQARSFAIRDLAEDLAARMPDGPFDLLAHVARPFSVRIIATMLGVPEEEDGQLLAWSKAMVTMYQAGRTVADEERAAKAAGAFSARLDRIFAARRADPQDDLITRLLRISEEGDLSAAEVTATCILLLNAGHEATIHTLGNGVAGLLRTG
ncbi:MAG: cytochrome P450, partial [Pseudomonadota bacterium]